MKFLLRSPTFRFFNFVILFWHLVPTSYSLNEPCRSTFGAPHLHHLRSTPSFAKKNDLRDLEYCTLPRTGALEVALKVLNSDAETANGTAAATASDAKGKLTLFP